MKKAKVTTIFYCTDEFYENELKVFKNDVLTGKMQREMLDGNEEGGLRSVKITFELLSDTTEHHQGKNCHYPMACTDNKFKEEQGCENCKYWYE